MTAHSIPLLALIVGSVYLAACSTEGSAPAPLQVSGNGHYFVTADGEPFIVQADTAWWLAERSTREDVVKYLDTRREQGFNVVMVAATLGFDDGVNAYGQKIWAGDASHPNPEFFDHVDFIVERAEARGMRVALAPAWVASVTPPYGKELTLQNAYGYGRWIGERYRHHDIIWLMGGDDWNWHEAIVREVARGVTNGVTGSDTGHDGVTITYHPARGRSSAEMFHEDAWLDFNMAQSGHCEKTLAAGNYLTTSDFNRLPAKPTIDGESYYEGTPLCWDPRQGYSTAQQVRNGLYNGVFGGGAGFAYGHNSVWQMYQPGRTGLYSPLSYWYDALDDEVAADAQYLRRLLESRPILTRVPDGGTGSGTAGTRYTRADDGAYIMGYSTDGQALTFDLDTLSGDEARLWWFDPRTGQATDAGNQAALGAVTKKPPSNQDWVLVADDVARGFPAPGSFHVE
jgi:Protein of unknown function (DUF4038)/Putative collagen-binding domain of a collagenase